jgi:hypothetical protein
MGEAGDFLQGLLVKKGQESSPPCVHSLSHELLHYVLGTEIRKIDGKVVVKVAVVDIMTRVGVKLELMRSKL